MSHIYVKSLIVIGWNNGVWYIRQQTKSYVKWVIKWKPGGNIELNFLTVHTFSLEIPLQLSFPELTLC